MAQTLINEYDEALYLAFICYPSSANPSYIQNQNLPVVTLSIDVIEWCNAFYSHSADYNTKYNF